MSTVATPTTGGPAGPGGLAALIGTPYSAASCWDVARHTLRLLGMPGLPANPATAVALGRAVGRVVPAGAALRRGDILVMHGDHGAHVAVALDHARAVHTTRESGACVARIGDLKAHHRGFAAVRRERVFT